MTHAEVLYEILEDHDPVNFYYWQLNGLDRHQERKKTWRDLME